MNEIKNFHVVFTNKYGSFLDRFWWKVSSQQILKKVLDFLKEEEKKGKIWSLKNIFVFPDEIKDIKEYQWYYKGEKFISRL